MARPPTSSPSGRSTGTQKGTSRPLSNCGSTARTTPWSRKTPRTTTTQMASATFQSQGLAWGPHRFSFSASDGISTFSTLLRLAPCPGRRSRLQLPRLEGEVEPWDGLPSDHFEFRATYWDEEGDAPRFVKLTLDGKQYGMKPEDPKAKLGTEDFKMGWSTLPGWMVSNGAALPLFQYLRWQPLHADRPHRRTLHLRRRSGLRLCPRNRGLRCRSLQRPALHHVPIHGRIRRPRRQGPNLSSSTWTARRRT